MQIVHLHHQIRQIVLHHLYVNFCSWIVFGKIQSYWKVWKVSTGGM